MPAAVTPSTDLTSIKLKQNERSRALAEALIARAFTKRPDAQQVGNGVVSHHWTNTLADVLSAGLGAYQARKLDEQELDLVETQAKSDEEDLARVLGGGLGVPEPAPSVPPVRPPMALPSMGGPPLQSPNPGSAPTRVLPQQDLAAIGKPPVAAPTPAPEPNSGPLASPMPTPALPAAAASPNPTGIPPRAQAMLEQLGAQEEQLSNTLRQYTYLAATNPRLAAGLENPIKFLSDQLKALNDAKFKIVGELSNPNFGIDYQSINDQGFAMSGGVATPTVDARTLYAAPVQIDGGAILQAEDRPGGKVESVLGYQPKGNSVSVSIQPEDKARAAMAEQLAKTVAGPLGNAINRMEAAPAAFRVLDSLEAINRTLTLSGPQANWGKAVLGFAEGMGLPLSEANRARLVNTQVYDSNVSKQVFDEIEALGAARSMTNEDMKAFREIFANSTLSVAARQRIIDQTRTRTVNRIQQDRTLMDGYLASPDIPEDQKNLIRLFRDRVQVGTAADIMGGASDAPGRPR